MRDAEGRIIYDAGPPCGLLGVPWQHAPAGELFCGKPKGHGGRHEHHLEADGRSAYRVGGELDTQVVQIGPLGEH